MVGIFRKTSDGHRRIAMQTMGDLRRNQPWVEVLNDQQALRIYDHPNPAKFGQVIPPAPVPIPPIPEIDLVQNLDTMNVVSNIVYDDGGLNNNGVLYSLVSQPPTLLAGGGPDGVANALSFADGGGAGDGAGMVLTSANEPMITDVTGGYTIACWFRRVIGNYGTLFRRSNSLEFNLHSTSLSFHTYQGNQWRGNVSIACANDNNWHFAVARFNRSDLAGGLSSMVFLDGAWSANVPPVDWTIDNATAASAWGATPSGGDYFTGRMAKMRIYNRALEDAEVTQLYNEVSVP